MCWGGVIFSPCSIRLAHDRDIIQHQWVSLHGADIQIVRSLTMQEIIILNWEGGGVIFLPCSIRLGLAHDRDIIQHQWVSLHGATI